MRRPLVIAALAVAGGAALAALALAQPADPPAAPLREVPPGFDHIGHDGKVSVSGADPIPCGACHTLRADGRLASRPDHKACFGACHGDPPPRRRGRAPYPVAEDRRRVCQACHAPAALAEVIAGSKLELKVAYPPYTIDPDYSITFPHDRHHKAADAIGGCAICHATPPDPGVSPAARPPAHTRCARCHGKSAQPPMTGCPACHLAAFGPATSPHIVRSRFAVTGRFSHRNHLPRVGDRRCAGCHAGVASASGDELPAPATANCAACHDGKRAFGTVEPACTRCHSAPRERIRRAAMPREQYSHASHRDRGVMLPCANCHRGTQGAATGLGEPRHAPCSDSGCHAAEFVSTQPTMCTVCHVGFEPWRPLHVEHRGRTLAEFGVTFDHASHLGGDTPRMRSTCQGCHQPDSQHASLIARDDHDGCSGKGCHDDGAAPALGECDACHRAGARADRRRARVAAPFSVRARFDHRPHRYGADGAPVACDRCHGAVTDSHGLDDIATPGKPTCAPCHDGATAFKMTGHGCQRCHGKL